MKKLFLSFILLPLLLNIAHAQTAKVPSQMLFDEGYRYMIANGKPYNPEKAKQLFKQSAEYGNGRAMNAVANLFTTGTSVNADSAIKWYKKAASTGYTNAYYNLGRIYQTGDLVPQDFIKAATYYKAGSDAGDKACKNWLAYFYYKGFGVQQNYTQAFVLYSELAESGDRNARYFLGKCYRNGYGTMQDNDLAKQWLIKSANAGEPQAIHELNAEPLPDNAFVYNPGLREKVKALKSYTENFIAANTNDISGSYKGYAVYYDFSRQYVLEVVPLNLTINRNINKYTGTWTEGDSLSALIKAAFTNNTFVFDSSCRYVRHNHYSDRDAEPYLFNKAALSIKYMNDSIYLSGEVQFYSINRKEPGQPMYIALSSKMNNVSTVNNFHLALMPNPANTLLRADFTLNKTARVQVGITDAKGNWVQKIASQTLPSGSYSYSFDIHNLAAGNYILQLSTGSKSESKIFIKL